jgi:hypothetical protein
MVEPPLLERSPTPAKASGVVVVEARMRPPGDSPRVIIDQAGHGIEVEG